MSARYHFLPWSRRGVSSTIERADPLTSALTPRVDLPVRFSVNGQPNVGVDLAMYGPGDVTGIDVRQIVRTDPAPNTAAFEPNYFPMVEFDRPDFPWLFTPAAADGQGRLRPWLVLVVVRQQPGVAVSFRRGTGLAVLSIAAPADPGAELPDLSESWGWCHAQVVTVPDAPAIEPHLVNDTVQTVSRLVCPRRLEPQARYVACVVPAFAVGVAAGFGRVPDVAPTTLEPAWDLSQRPNAVELPVYHHWEFGTGPAGDFESLAERLTGGPVPDGVGTLDVEVTDLGFGLPDPGRLLLQGALIPPSASGDDPIGPVDEAVRGPLRELLNLPASLADDPQGPVVAPPIYGGYQASAPQVTSTDGWLAELNLDLRARAAAGLGVAVVQEKQEQLMAAAWKQLADDPPRRRRLDFGHMVLARVYARRFATQSAPQLVLLTAPSHARVRAEPESTETMRASLRQSLPAALTSTTFRKTARPNRHILGTVSRPSTRAAFSNLLVSADTFVVAQSLTPRQGQTEDTVANRALEDRVTRLSGLIAFGLPPGNPDTVEQRETALRLRDATQDLRGYFEAAIDRPPPKPAPRRPNWLELAGELVIRPTHFTQLTMVTRPAVLVAGGVIAPAPSAVSTVVPGPPGPPADEAELAPLVRGPNFATPMYESLRDRSPEYLLPGADRIPPNTVTLLATNRRFVESFMVGLNHEMGRELLWREFPSSQRHTSFRTFWQSVTAAAAAGGQLPPIHTWDPAAELGGNSADNGEQLVLLVRGDLLLRYPNTFMYAANAESRTKMGPDRKLPIFVGRIDPDLVFIGFDLTPDQARGRDGTSGWFFVLEQPAGEARFGLDELAEFGRDPATVGSDLAWSDMAASEADLAALTHAPLDGRLAGQTIGPGRWAFNGAHQAALTLQRPFSYAVHADEMLAEEP